MFFTLFTLLTASASTSNGLLVFNFLSLDPGETNDSSLFSDVPDFKVTVDALIDNGGYLPVRISLGSIDLGSHKTFINFGGTKNLILDMGDIDTVLGQYTGLKTILVTLTEFGYGSRNLAILELSPRLIRNGSEDGKVFSIKGSGNSFLLQDNVKNEPAVLKIQVETFKQ
jgi:hypothetical protein